MPEINLLAVLAAGIARGLTGLIVMSAAIFYALAFGRFAAGGARIISHPWGIVSPADLYTGFALS